MPDPIQLNLMSLSRRSRIREITLLKAKKQITHAGFIYLALVSHILTRSESENWLHRLIVGDFTVRPLQMDISDNNASRERLSLTPNDYCIYDKEGNRLPGQRISGAAYRVHKPTRDILGVGDDMMFSILYDHVADAVYRTNDINCNKCPDNFIVARELNPLDKKEISELVRDFDRDLTNERYHVLDTFIVAMMKSSYPIALPVLLLLPLATQVKHNIHSGTCKSILAVLTFPLWFPTSIALLGIGLSLSLVAYIATIVLTINMLLADKLIVTPISSLINACRKEAIEPIDTFLADEKSGDERTLLLA